jgi:predicted ABC-type ATPase
LTATALVIGGPNGTGKSTLAEEFAKHKRLPLLSADKIAYALAPPSEILSVRSEAARSYYQALDVRISRRTSFVVETTLAGRGFLRPLENMQRCGYEIIIVFLSLDSEEACLARVRERVRKGGHDVPEQDVRRIFRRSADNFWNLYRPRANSWHMLYNGGTRFREIALGTQGGIVGVRDDQLFELFLSHANATHPPLSASTDDNVPFLRANDLLRVGNRAARAAQDESRDAGVPNVYVLDSVIQYELAKGKLTTLDPLGS